MIAALRAVRDPELPVSVYDLGLIYTIQADSSGAVAILMTLTAPKDFLRFLIEILAMINPSHRRQ